MDSQSTSAKIQTDRLPDAEGDDETELVQEAFSAGFGQVGKTFRDDAKQIRCTLLRVFGFFALQAALTPHLLCTFDTPSPAHRLPRYSSCPDSSDNFNW
jgi:hypothetical protein